VGLVWRCLSRRRGATFCFGIVALPFPAGSGETSPEVPAVHFGGCYHGRHRRHCPAGVGPGNPTGGFPTKAPGGGHSTGSRPPLASRTVTGPSGKEGTQ
jgi:hypothetical protein